MVQWHERVKPHMRKGRPVRGYERTVTLKKIPDATKDIRERIVKEQGFLEPMYGPELPYDLREMSPWQRQNAVDWFAERVTTESLERRVKLQESKSEEAHVEDDEFAIAQADIALDILTDAIDKKRGY